MTPAARRRWIHVTAGLAILAGTWSAGIALFGGIDAQLGSLKVSSNNPVNPLIVAILAGAAAWFLATADERRRFRAWLTASWLLSPRLAPVIAAAAAITVTCFGIFNGARGIGGADAYGYVSQAELWAEGRLSYEEPLVKEFEGKLPPVAFAPLGYLPTGDGSRMAPMYAPGLPLLIAPFRWIGGRDAMFLVVPLLAGLAVWSVYLMGSRLANGVVGAGAAIVLSTSPVFLLHTLITPMSDVPAATAWALALALAVRNQPGAALGAGLAASIAILIRPNLVPLAGIVAAPWLIRAFRRSDARRKAVRCLVAFGLGGVPGVTIVALVNNHLYGSPFLSGQVIGNPPLSLANVPINFSRYVSWLFQTQTYAVLAALLAPVLLARGRASAEDDSPAGAATMLLAFAATVFVSYLPFMLVPEWYWLRYVLPAFAPIFVLMCASVSAVVAKYGRDVRIITVCLVVALVAARTMAFNKGLELHRMGEGEEKYLLVGDYARTRSPDRSVFVSMLFSGTIKYYGGRPIVRYEYIAEDGFDRAIADLVAAGYRPFAVLEESELDAWTKRFGGRSALAALDWAPEIAFDHPSGVRIFDLTKR
jgi:hypothetical protein